jgi:hypothetical protein
MTTILARPQPGSDGDFTESEDMQNSTATPTLERAPN